MKNKRLIHRIANIVMYLIIYMLMVFIGFALGLIYEQVLVAQSFAHILSYTNIQVNFNATEFTKELNNTFIPSWKQAFNETLHNQLNISNKTS